MGFRSFLCLAICLASGRWTRGESAYQPPLLLSAPGPVSSSSALRDSYQPPIQYRSPVGGGAGPPAPSYSVVYTPPEIPRHALPGPFRESASGTDHKSLPTAYQQPGGVATSYSVHQQPASAERTAPSQAAIHKAPAPGVRAGESAADRDAAGGKKEEYVVYYYYYYDNDTAAGGHSGGAGNSNLSLSFDDIPSLEGYDQEAPRPGPESGANSLSPPSSPQGRSVSGSAQDAQPPRPVPNVFRYGSNEVPRFPVLPSFVVAPPTEVPPPAPEAPPQTTPSAAFDLDNELNNHVLEPRPNQREEPPPQSSPQTSSSTTTSSPETTTATMTEQPPTTEAPATTTERPRRRPPGGGGRRRFNPGTSPAPGTRPATSSTVAPPSSSTTRAAPSGRFQGGSNRVRSRPSSGFGRTRTASSSAPEEESSAPDSAPSGSSPAPPAVPRGRGATSQAPRRFQSSRSRSPQSSAAASSSSSSTTSTTRAPPRARTTSRPRPNIVGNRSRPPRPGFLRPRNPEPPQTTTAEPETTDAPEEEEEPRATPPSRDPPELEEGAGTDDEGEESEETEEAPPTTTEPSRFSALFKPRNRGSRPRPPLLGNRPPRV